MLKHCLDLNSMPLLSMAHNKHIAVKTFMKVIVSYLKTHKVYLTFITLDQEKHFFYHNNYTSCSILIKTWHLVKNEILVSKQKYERTTTTCWQKYAAVRISDRSHISPIRAPYGLKNMIFLCKTARVKVERKIIPTSFLKIERGERGMANRIGT